MDSLQFVEWNWENHKFL